MSPRITTVVLDMAMRSRFRRPQERVFRVTLTVHRLDSIPAVHREFYVHWQARRAQPSNGRTPNQAIEAAAKRVMWNTTQSFTVTIPSDPTDSLILQPSILTLQLRSERKSRWASSNAYNMDGSVELDIAELAALRYVSRNFLVENSPLNITLKLSIRVTHEQGEKLFRSHGDGMSLTRGMKNRQLRDRATSQTDSTQNSVPSLDHTTAGTSSSTVADAQSAAQSVASTSTFSIAGVGTATAASSQTSISPDAASAPAPTPATELLAKPDSDEAAKWAPFPDPLIPKTKHTTFPYPGGHRFVFGEICEPVYDPTLDVQFRPHVNSDGTISLLNRIPNPDEVQQEVYEYMWRRRLREKWPTAVVTSRGNALDDVKATFKELCKEDNIKMNILQA